MAKYTYEVGVTRTVTSYGTFLVESDKKLTDEEVREEAMAMANQGKQPDSDWEETDVDYIESEVVDGNDNLKED